MRRAEIVREGKQHVVVPLHASTEALEVALAGQMEHRGTRPPEALDGQLVQAPRPLASAEDDEHRPVGRKAEQPTTFSAGHGPRAGGDRPARDLVLRPALALDRKREEDALRERGRQAVRETDMRIGLH